MLGGAVDFESTVYAIPPRGHIKLAGAVGVDPTFPASKAGTFAGMLSARNYCLYHPNCLEVSTR